MTTPQDPADQPLAGRNVIVGVSGGIACYKTATIVSRLAQHGAAVTVLMTDAATQFISPLTFEALSGRPVYTSMWDRIESHDPQHISLARQCDLMLIAPATVDLVARLAFGFANDIITLIVSAVDRANTPVVIAPSANTVMLQQPATQRNLEQLRKDGFVFVEPGVGWQACREVGPGRMAEPEELLATVTRLLSGQ